jgi:hypothetical protein
MFVCCVLSGRGPCDKRSLVQRSPTDCGASLCVIKKPRGRWGHSLCWAWVPEKIINNQTVHIYIYIYIYIYVFFMPCALNILIRCISVHLFNTFFLFITKHFNIMRDFKFSIRHFGRFESSELWRSVAGLVVPKFLKKGGALIRVFFTF